MKERYDDAQEDEIPCLHVCIGRRRNKKKEAKRMLVYQSHPKLLKQKEMERTRVYAKEGN